MLFYLKKKKLKKTFHLHSTINTFQDQNSIRRPQTKTMRSCSGSSKSQEKQLQHHHTHCCLSHLFLQSAAENPSKVAVIHAARSSSAPSSGPQIQISRELITSTTSTTPIYEGDHCFTFASMLISVDSLSSRLRSILDGADDPHLSKPQSPPGNYLSICFSFLVKEF